MTISFDEHRKPDNTVSIPLEQAEQIINRIACYLLDNAASGPHWEPGGDCADVAISYMQNLQRQLAERDAEIERLRHELRQVRIGRDEYMEALKQELFADGPDAPDCPNRGSSRQRRCAALGCGFCQVAEEHNEAIKKLRQKSRPICEEEWLEERDLLLGRIDRLRRELERPSYHSGHITDAGHCAPGCRACEALRDNPTTDDT